MQIKPLLKFWWRILMKWKDLSIGRFDCIVQYSKWHHRKILSAVNVVWPKGNTVLPSSTPSCHFTFKSYSPLLHPSPCSLFTSPSHPAFIPFQHIHPIALCWPCPSSPRLSITADHTSFLSSPLLKSLFVSPWPSPWPYTSSHPWMTDWHRDPQTSVWKMREGGKRGTEKGGMIS